MRDLTIYSKSLYYVFFTIRTWYGLNTEEGIGIFIIPYC
jgi:hypothetical protein